MSEEKSMTHIWKNRDFFERIRIATLSLMVVFLMIRRVAPLDRLGAQRIWPLLLILLSAGLLAWDFFVFRTVFRGKRLYLLFAFLAINLISIFLNRNLEVSSSLSLFVYYVIQMFLIYSMTFSYSREKVLRDLKTLTNVFLVCQVILEILALITFLYDIEFSYFSSIAAKMIEQGYQPQYGRIWGVYYEANFLGISSLTAALLSVWGVYRSKNAWMRLLYGLSAALGFVVLILSGSRTVFIALNVVLFFAGVALFPTLRERFSAWKGALLSAVVIAALIGGAFAGQFLIEVGAPKVQQAVVSVTSPKTLHGLRGLFYHWYESNGFKVTMKDYAPKPKRVKTQAEIEAEKEQAARNKEVRDAKTALKEKKDVRISKIIARGVLTVDAKDVDRLERRDMQRSDDISNRRFEIWQEGFRVFLKRPVFGVSMRNAVTFAKVNHLSKSHEFLIGKTVLNGYFEVLVGTGVLGFAALGSFVFLAGTDYLRYLAKKRRDSFTVAVTGLLIVAFMVFALFLSDVFCDFTINSFLFWLLLGAGSALMEGDSRVESR